MSDETIDVTPYGGHHLLLELGRGGTAQVFVAVQSGAQGVDKLVVLKFLRPAHVDNPELQQMFIDEARFSARLNHANIVQTNAIIETTRGPAIVMEYLDGQPLSAIRSRALARLSLEMHIRIVIDVLRGLHYAHELTDLDGEPLNVVHRDVSPHNVFVTYDGQVKLIDFGIVKLVGRSVETATGVIKGKVAYMPPEQIEGSGVDRRADLYAVGVMLWEAATGTRMWKGATDVAIMHRVLLGDVPRPSAVTPDIPEELERIILKALATNREHRHATALELESDLEAFLATRPPATNREIGRFLAREFEDIRAETKRIIDQEMKRWAAAAHSSAPLSVRTPPLLAPSLAPAGYTAMSGSSSGPSDARETGASSRMSKARRPLFIGAIVLVGSIVAWRAATGARGITPAPSAAALSPAASASLPASATAPSLEDAAPPPAPEDATQPAAPEGSAQPPRAASSASAAEPTSKQPEPTSKAHAPRAAGGRSKPRPKPVSKPTATATATATAEPVATATGSARAPKPNCDVPYTIDADGIKRFKIECM
ncbi:serine/threonine-protein kinase [Sorangium sp. So ce1036]|uniref:serine/threonine protein kinase n=1 Tax=Sorangium sp. So ce1036 TaxID=3133328 RepID=UPI003F027551